MKKFWSMLVNPGYVALGIYFVFLGVFGLITIVTAHNFKHSLLLTPGGAILVFIFLLFAFGGAKVWTNFSTKIKVENFLRASLCFAYCVLVLFQATSFQKFRTDGVIVSQNLEILREVREGWNYIDADQKYSFVSFSEWEYKIELPYMDASRSMGYKNFNVVILLKPMDNARFVSAIEKKTEIEKHVFKLVYEKRADIANSKNFPFQIVPNDSFLVEYVDKIEIRR
jgi:hypothetical protein